MSIGWSMGSEESGWEGGKVRFPSSVSWELVAPGWEDAIRVVVCDDEGFSEEVDECFAHIDDFAKWQSQKLGIEDDSK